MDHPTWLTRRTSALVLKMVKHVAIPVVCSTAWTRYTAITKPFTSAKRSKRQTNAVDKAGKFSVRIVRQSKGHEPAQTSKVFSRNRLRFYTGHASGRPRQAVTKIDCVRASHKQQKQQKLLTRLPLHPGWYTNRSRDIIRIVIQGKCSAYFYKYDNGTCIFRTL